MNTTHMRLTYLDNLRNILVYAVVVFHIMCMYAYPMVFFWPVVDISRSSSTYETIILTMDIFLMPVLIFIAALFILPSFKARSAAGYVRKRFQRLIIPMIVFLFCAGDIFHQFLLMRLGGPVPEYSRIFLDYWGDLITGGAITSVGKDKMLYQVGFNMLHSWFLSFLFIMTLLVVVFRLIFRKSDNKPAKIDSRNMIVVKTVLIALVSGIVYCVICIALSLAGADLNSWIRVFGLIQVRVNQFFMLAPLFLFGLYLFRKQWLTHGDIGSWKMWGILSGAILIISVFLAYSRYIPMIEPFVRIYEHNLLSVDTLSYPAITKEFEQIFTVINFIQLPLCIFLLMFFLSFTKKFFNTPNNVTDFCSKHSINVYILHYVPVVLLQYCFNKLSLPPAATIIAITLIVIPSCIWLSYRFVYPHPVAAILMFAVAKMASLYLGFQFYFMMLMAIIAISFCGALFETVRLAVNIRHDKLNATLPSQ